MAPAAMRKLRRGSSNPAPVLACVMSADFLFCFACPALAAGGQVIGVAVENHQLRPGESTNVFVIRRGGER